MEEASTPSHRTENRAEQRKPKRKKKVETMARKTKEKAITKEIQGLLKKMGINLKFQACSHFQTEIVDMEGHNKLMHLSDLTKVQIFSKNCNIAHLRTRKIWTCIVVQMRARSTQA
ncbi:hypothetical protein ACLB2K_075773 [Fragaria x ananassa]